MNKRFSRLLLSAALSMLTVSMQAAQKPMVRNFRTLEDAQASLTRISTNAKKQLLITVAKIKQAETLPQKVAQLKTLQLNSENYLATRARSMVYVANNAQGFALINDMAVLLLAAVTEIEEATKVEIHTDDLPDITTALQEIEAKVISFVQAFMPMDGKRADAQYRATIFGGAYGKTKDIIQLFEQTIARIGQTQEIIAAEATAPKIALKDEKIAKKDDQAFLAEAVRQNALPKPTVAANSMPEYLTWYINNDQTLALSADEITAHMDLCADQLGCQQHITAPAVAFYRDNITAIRDQLIMLAKLNTMIAQPNINYAELQAAIISCSDALSDFGKKANAKIFSKPMAIILARTTAKVCPQALTNTEAATVLEEIMETTSQTMIDETNNAAVVASITEILKTLTTVITADAFAKAIAASSWHRTFWIMDKQHAIELYNVFSSAQTLAETFVKDLAPRIKEQYILPLLATRKNLAKAVDDSISANDEKKDEKKQ